MFACSSTETNQDAGTMSFLYSHCKPTPLRIDHGRIPEGYAGTLETVRQISRLIREGAKDLCVRQHAIAIFREYDVRAKDSMREVLALFDWVRNHIRYTRDIYKVELLHSARRMLELRAGDCDDQVILLGAMLESTGHPVRLVLVGSDPRNRKRYSHILLETNDKGHWISLDPTMDKPAGWSPRAVNRKVVEIRRTRRGARHA